MFTTAILVGLLIGLLVMLFVLWAVFLRIGLRWARVEDVQIRRVLLATAMVFSVNMAIAVCFAFVDSTSESNSIVVGLLELGLSVIASTMLISTVFKLRFARGFKAWIPTLCAPLVVVALVFFVVRPWCYKTFKMVSNPMAPTLVGDHSRGTCPKCGQASYYTPADKDFARTLDPTMICDNFHVEQSSNSNTSVYSGDRVVVAKFLTPRRWDLVAFQVPGNPTEAHVFRLVGLPGEAVHIEDGLLWINGEKLTPPDSLHGLEYLSQLPSYEGPEVWGAVERPAVLGGDEYFVLGDFSAKAFDSRFWRGAPGRNSFAVPESNIIGVVTHTYWPPNRLRIHR